MEDMSRNSGRKEAITGCVMAGVGLLALGVFGATYHELDTEKDTSASAARQSEIVGGIGKALSAGGVVAILGGPSIIMARRRDVQ